MDYLQKIVEIIEKCKKEKPCEIDIRYNEPMAAYTTFKTGGPADCLLRPSGGNFPAFAVELLAAARIEKIPVFILGGGANILVSDAGISGIVLDTGGWTGISESPTQNPLSPVFRAGTTLDAAAEAAADAGLSGLEFFAGMPGTVGGAVWMNARCYRKETSDVLAETEVIDFSVTPPEHNRLPVDKDKFAYKQSPFQGCAVLIVSAMFKLTPKDPGSIRAEMDSCRRDREEKGHYRFPSAGSVFKNNTAFGNPTGKIIDELGLRGFQTGGAQVAPWHGNIIINKGEATAADIRKLIEEVASRVKAATSFVLEPEILFIGRW